MTTKNFSDKRFVIKLGSSTIFDENDNLIESILDTIAYQINKLVDQGFEIVVVTSGAVAFGRKRLGFEDGDIVGKQELAAAGSTKLFAAWADAFAKYGKITIDHLLSEQDVSAISTGSPKWPLLEELKNHKYIPIINANDSVNTFELEKLAISADNDRLSKFVAELVNAGGLIMLTESEGVWDGNKQIIDRIESEEDLHGIYIGPKTGQGTGGIESKIQVATEFAVNGRSAWITHSKNNSILKIVDGEQIGTRIRMSQMGKYK